MAHFDLPLDLPHAGRIADRILTLVERHSEERGLDAAELIAVIERLSNLLFRYSDDERSWAEVELARVRDQAAALSREMVGAMEATDIRGDRVGQLVRNLFECLSLGEEGAAISLRAGENPQSFQRPV